jgi:hypothetical protein
VAVLGGQVAPGKNVVVVDHTGQQVGCAVAELVADRGGRAEVVSRQFHPAVDFGLTNTVSLYRRLFRKGVELTAHHDLRDVQGGAVTLFNYYNQRERRLEGVDQVVVVTSPRPNDALLQPLRDAGFDVRAVGDCVAPRDIEYATYEGLARVSSLARVHAAMRLHRPSAAAPMVRVVDFHRQRCSVGSASTWRWARRSPSSARAGPARARCSAASHSSAQRGRVLDDVLVGERRRTATLR